MSEVSTARSYVDDMEGRYYRLRSLLREAGEMAAAIDAWVEELGMYADAGSKPADVFQRNRALLSRINEALGEG